MKIDIFNLHEQFFQLAQFQHLVSLLLLVEEMELLAYHNDNHQTLQVDH